MPRTGLVLLLLFTPLATHATELLNLAHKAGFDRCDTAIETEFRDMRRVGNGVASTGYFNDRSFNIMATWGNEHDSVWKNTTFIKFGRNCLAYSVINTTFKSGCVTFKDKNPKWQVIKEQGNFIWTRNPGGVNAVLKALPNGVCAITYRIHQTYDSNAAPVARQKPDSTEKPSG